MPKNEKQRNYLKLFRRAMSDPDIAERFQCIAKFEVANFLRKDSLSKKNKHEAFTLFKDIIKSKDSRSVDRKDAKKNYKKLSKELKEKPGA